MKDSVTFPLILVSIFHFRIKQVAKKMDKSINRFIMEAIEEKIKREE